MNLIEIQGDNEVARYDWISGLLKQGIYNITFKKIDGDFRTMPCTLDPSLMPDRKIQDNDEAITPLNFSTLSVFVTDIQQWRSFRVMNLIEVSQP